MAWKFHHNNPNPSTPLQRQHHIIMINLIITILLGSTSSASPLLPVIDRSEILEKAVIGDWQAVLSLIDSSSLDELARQVSNGYYGGSVLHLAAAAGRQDIVEALIQSAKIDLDLPNEFWGKTPLIIAAEFGWYNIVELLLASGASVSAVDADGDTALHEAAFNGFLDTVKLLVDHGADFTSLDRAGNAPADDARLGRRFLVVSYLENLMEGPATTTTDERPNRHSRTTNT